VERALDLLPGLLIRERRERNTTDFGAERAGERRDLDPLVWQAMQVQE
jgi:hypothetical protein